MAAKFAPTGVRELQRDRSEICRIRRILERTVQCQCRDPATRRAFVRVSSSELFLDEFRVEEEELTCEEKRERQLAFQSGERSLRLRDPFVVGSTVEDRRRTSIDPAIQIECNEEHAVGRDRR